MQKIVEKDEYGNWTQRTGFALDGHPTYITKRSIIYEGMESDWERLALQDKVKSVRQYSYIAVPMGVDIFLLMSLMLKAGLSVMKLSRKKAYL